MASCNKEIKSWWILNFFCTPIFILNIYCVVCCHRRSISFSYFWQTDDLFNKYHFKYWGRVDLGQEHLLKLNFRFFSLLDLGLEAFWFHFSLLEKEWKHLFFTLQFSKKSESIFFSLCTSRKRVKASFFHFSLLELLRSTLAGAWFTW